MIIRYELRAVIKIHDCHRREDRTHLNSSNIIFIFIYRYMIYFIGNHGILFEKKHIDRELVDHIQEILHF